MLVEANRPISQPAMPLFHQRKSAVGNEPPSRKRSGLAPACVQEVTPASKQETSSPFSSATTTFYAPPRKISAPARFTPPQPSPTTSSAGDIRFPPTHCKLSQYQNPNPQSQPDFNAVRIPDQLPDRNRSKYRAGSNDSLYDLSTDGYKTKVNPLGLMRLIMRLHTVARERTSGPSPIPDPNGTKIDFIDL